jgi:hypothetical protein
MTEMRAPNACKVEMIMVTGARGGPAAGFREPGAGWGTWRRESRDPARVGGRGGGGFGSPARVGGRGGGG